MSCTIMAVFCCYIPLVTLHAPNETKVRLNVQRPRLIIFACLVIGDNIGDVQIRLVQDLEERIGIFHKV